MLVMPTQTLEPQARSKRYLICFGCALIATSLFIAFVYIALSPHVARRSALKVDVCNTFACQAYGVMITRTLNTSRNPCDDFYHYVCDGWNKMHATSVYENHMNQFVEQLSRELQVPVPANNQTAAQKAARLYQSCRAVATQAVDETENFRRILRDCDIDWPKISSTADALATLVKLYKTLRMDTLLNIGRTHHRGAQALRIFPASIVSNTLRRRGLINSRGKYEEYYANMVNFLKTADTKEDELQPYSTFARVEADILVDLHSAYRSGRNRPPLTLNLSQLHEITPSIPQIRWNLLLISEQVTEFSPKLPVLVENPQYVRTFSNLLRTNGEETVHLYIGWLAVQVIAPHLTSDVAGVYWGGQSFGLDNNVHLCLHFTEVAMGWAVYSQFNSKAFDQASLDKVRNITADIATSIASKFAYGVLDNATMNKIDSDLRRMLELYDRYQTGRALNEVFKNVSDMGSTFSANWLNVAKGLTDYYANGTDFVNSFFTNYITTSNVYSFDFGGTLLVPPYATMLPTFEPDIVDSVQSGALGTIIGVTVFNAIHKTLFNSSSKELQCYRNVFSNTHNADYLADSAISLEIAWNAYRSYAMRSGLRTRIKGLHSLSADKLFFISQCYLLCGPQDALHRAEMCNEPLRHSNAFSDTFTCLTGSAMNATKCSL
ncbi:neprilysin-1-like [Ornithodoros turicata]|uniref:neprilysin-1-like n=1 Tax=Ornithodoros turicata TaxID=34597 RepID=UPI00313870B3